MSVTIEVVRPLSDFFPVQLVQPKDSHTIHMVRSTDWRSATVTAACGRKFVVRKLKHKVDQLKSDWPCSECGLDKHPVWNT